MLGTLLALTLLTQATPPEFSLKSLSFDGVVVAADGKPVAGAEVLLAGDNPMGNGIETRARTRSDTAGKFHFDIELPAEPALRNRLLSVWAVQEPGPRVAAFGFLNPVRDLSQKTSLTLKLPAAKETAFRVLGPDGKPLAEARVEPGLTRVTGASGGPIPLWMPDDLGKRFATRTNAQGQARLPALAPEGYFLLNVISPRYGRQSVQVVEKAGGVGTVTLAPVGSVRGRITAEDPEAARGREVTLTTISPPGRGPLAQGFVRVTSDAEGRFEVPAIATGRLNVSIPSRAGQPERIHPPRERTVEAGKTTEIEIPIEGPERLRTVAGRVRDRQGKPVAGAVVLQSGDGPKRTRATTDDRGQFELPGVRAGRAFVFVTRPGFRFHGQPIDDHADAVDLTLIRSDEPPARILTTLSPPLPRDEELKVARRVLDPYAERVLKEGGESEKIQVLGVLAWVAPERVLERLEQKAFGNPFIDDMIRMRVVLVLAEQSPDEAGNLIEAMAESYPRAIAYVFACDALPASERAKKLDLLAQAMVQAKGVQDPAQRLTVLGQVADHWLDLGETEKATKLLREGLEIARKLPNAAWAGYARGSFAEELAPIDRTAALELTKDLSDPREFDRHHGNIAHELAAREPAEAERILGMVRDPRQRGQYAVRVAYRMAPVDRKRARTIAESINDPNERAYAFGMMALGLAKADKAAATELLDAAFTQLARAAEDGWKDTNRFHVPAPTAAALLPVAEQIDPALVDEFLWRAVSCRLPTTMEMSREGGALADNGVLTMLVARYDRELARAILGTDPGQLRAQAGRVVGRGEASVFVAVAILDPRLVVDLVDCLPDDPDLKPFQTKNAARIAVAQALARQGERRWKYLTSRFTYLWIPDTEDINPNL